MLYFGHSSMLSKISIFKAQLIYNDVIGAMPREFSFLDSSAFIEPHPPCSATHAVAQASHVPCPPATPPPPREVSARFLPSLFLCLFTSRVAYIFILHACHHATDAPSTFCVRAGKYRCCHINNRSTRHLHIINRELLVYMQQH
jgi:hypothetical protein